MVGPRRSKSIDVESTEPVLSNFSPAHDTAGLDARPDVSVDVTDSDSGVVKSKVYVVFATLDIDADDKEVLGANEDGGAPYSVQADVDGRLRDVTGGYSALVRMPPELERNEDMLIAWWVVAYDKAGNVQVSDQDTSDDSVCEPMGFLDIDPNIAGADDYSDPQPVNLVGSATVATDGAKDQVAGCQPFVVRVDSTPPSLESAETGWWWNPDIDGSDKTEIDASKAKDTSIVVMFNEDLDGSSVSAGDFEVDDGASPLDAAHYGGAPSSVFLTVPALEPGETPKVELVGEVADLAGNSVDSGVKESNETEDGIAPTVTVMLAGVTSGARPVTDSKVVITIETNENTANPSVRVRKITAATAEGMGLVDLDATPPNVPTPKVKGPRTYETTFTASSDGLYNVYVTATDGSNPGTAGVTGMMDVDHDDNDDTDMETVNAPIDLSSDTSALLFEVDSEGPSFVLDDPNTDDPNAESDDPNAFVRIDFSGEGNESPLPVKGSGEDDDYFGSDSLVLDTTEEGTKDADSYGMVTILSATLAGDDISGSLERLGGDSFLFVAPNLEVGDYKVVIDAEDEAGNDNEASATLSITERKPFVLTVRAGVSLISFPGDPLDPERQRRVPGRPPGPGGHNLRPDPAGPVVRLQAGRGHRTVRRQPDGDQRRPGLPGTLELHQGRERGDRQAVFARPADPTADRPGRRLEPGAGNGHHLPDQAGRHDLLQRLLRRERIHQPRVRCGHGSQQAHPGETARTLTRPMRTAAAKAGGNLEVGKGYWVFASEATSIAPGVASE